MQRCAKGVKMMGKQERRCSLLAFPIPVTSDLDIGAHRAEKELGKINLGSSSPFLLTAPLLTLLSYKCLKQTVAFGTLPAALAVPKIFTCSLFSLLVSQLHITNTESKESRVLQGSLLTFGLYRRENPQKFKPK